MERPVKRRLFQGFLGGYYYYYTGTNGYLILVGAVIVSLGV